MDEFDLDRATEVGWAGFLTRLAGHLGSSTEPLRISAYGADEGTFPVLQITPGDDVLHGELSGPDGIAWPDAARREHLLALGWHGDDGYGITLPRSHAHLLASIVTDTLREVVGAPHPAFLDAGALTISAPPGPDEGGPEPPQIDLDQAIRVITPGELRQAVETTLHAAMGHPPRHDADGDIPILYGTTLVYVRTADSQPVVTIFGILVQDVEDLEAAHREVGILNRQSVFAKFHVVGDQVVASVAIPSLPFVPRHLVGMVELMGKELDQLDDALALRVRGRRWIDLMTGEGAAPVEPEEDPDEEDVDELPEELLTLLQLDADGDGRLEPALVADVCRRDRSLILRLIRIAEEQTISWRESVDEARAAGDVEEARTATDEVQGWQATVSDLRAALRHLVTFGRGDDEAPPGR
jgi:hypothetical protein